jgi:hypothetical protein
MADKPAPFVFPAFRTPAGLAIPSAFEHTNDYAESQGQAKQIDQRTNGVWLDVPYSPGLFTAVSAGTTWTVPKAQVNVYRYKLAAAELRLNFNVGGTLAGGTSSGLKIELPERRKARAIVGTIGYGTDTSGGFPTLLYLVTGGRVVTIYNRFGYANWQPGAVTVGGQLLIEVEEQ